MNTRGWRVVLFVSFTAFVVGCDDPAPKPDASASPGAVQTAPIQTRKTVGKTTQNVLDVADAKAQGGVVVDNAAEAEEGGLGAYSQAYRHSVATIGGLAVEQKMKLFEAEYGRKPGTHAEFMDRIIEKGRPGAVSLPALPSGKAYAFDPQRKAVVVVALPQDTPPPP